LGIGLKDQQDRSLLVSNMKKIMSQGFCWNGFSVALACIFDHLLITLTFQRGLTNMI